MKVNFFKNKESVSPDERPKDATYYLDRIQNGKHKELITNLRAEINPEKKKAIKQGTMQELLTGKRKLPGFSGKWELNTLGDVCVLKNWYAFKSSLYNENWKYKIITIANVQDGFMHSLVTNNIIELPSDIQLHQILVKGEILISMTWNVGRVAQVNNNNLLLNQRVWKLCPLEWMDNKFFYYLCNSRKFLNSMVSKAVWGAQWNIWKSDILEYITNIPKDNEKIILKHQCDQCKNCGHWVVKGYEFAINGQTQVLHQMHFRKVNDTFAEETIQALNEEFNIQKKQLQDAETMPLRQLLFERTNPIDNKPKSEWYGSLDVFLHGMPDINCNCGLCFWKTNKAIKQEIRIIFWRWEEV